MHRKGEFVVMSKGENYFGYAWKTDILISDDSTSNVFFKRKNHIIHKHVFMISSYFSFFRKALKRTKSHYKKVGHLCPKCSLQIIGYNTVAMIRKPSQNEIKFITIFLSEVFFLIFKVDFQGNSKCLSIPAK